MLYGKISPSRFFFSKKATYVDFKVHRNALYRSHGNGNGNGLEENVMQEI